jgi:hypothetical protein
MRMILMLLIGLAVAGPAVAGVPPVGDGVIEGVVVRAVDQTPVPGAEVVLRAKVDGQGVPAAQTKADAKGRFRFERLPADGAYVYLPGANRDGIHYPGPSVRLSSLRRRAEVKLTVHDAAAFPNPLVVHRHTITLCPEPGLLRVTESMLIDNPSMACYIGQSASKDAEPITLRLAIPADFENVTFATEFFGRRFSVFQNSLVTSVPWPPGQRELSFSYVLANQQAHYVWQRPLDLPSANVQVEVRGDRTDQIICNLDRAVKPKDGQLTFESNGATLPAGYMLRVELGHLPVSPMAYAPWWALALLTGSIVATSLLGRRK